ncbi:MAG: hypothetical protein APF81_05165 [Desulfosporosinus sp. BRH_c37]|nr:MAG: hypothetical protein APF81_05165 [Desulfosporosinus sp. BRH_c37]
MSFSLLFTILIISYLLAFLLGRRFRYLMPKGKEFEIALACSIGIMIIFMTKTFWFPSDRNDLFFTIGFGLASGFSSAIYNRKRK